jgi:hypothetical protein
MLFGFVVATTACDKPQSGPAATASSAAPAPSPVASTVPVPSGSVAAAPSFAPLAAEPPLGEVKPAPKAPFESIRLRMRAERGDEGWPEYDAVNLSTKTIKWVNFYGYAYDKDGKQVGRTKPLGWSNELKPGAHTTLPIRIGRFEDKVSTDAVAFELCYTAIEFVGEKKSIHDDDRCPDQKAKGK